MTEMETIQIWIDYDRMKIAYQHEPRDPIFVTPDEARENADVTERNARAAGKFVEPLPTLVADLREHAATLERAIDATTDPEVDQ